MEAKRPWTVSKCSMRRNRFLNPMVQCADSHEPIIAEICGKDRLWTEKMEIAAFIVRACNCHDELLEALKLVTEMDDDPIRFMGCRSARYDFARAAIAQAVTT